MPTAAPPSGLGRLDGHDLVLTARGLARRFGDVAAVDGIDLDIARGSVVGLLGPNGTGKSTLLRILTGLVRPDAGTASVAGVELRGDGTAVRKRVAFAPGEIALYGELRAGEMLEWLLRGRGRAAEEKARALCAELALPLKKRVHAFSHGMKRQLLFAAALAPDLPLRILDEPTEGLDPAKRNRVLELIAADADEGRAILLSSHHLSEVEAVCQRILFCHKGKLLADEDPADLRALAARSGRLDFEAPVHAAAAARALEGQPNVLRAEARDATVWLELESGAAPFTALSALDAALPADLPRPLAVELGRLSLTELFERIYGVRGL